MALVALAPTLAVAYVTMVPLGYAAMVFMINGNTMLQLNARPEARGRVMALYGIVFLGSTPIGAPIAGWIGQVIGPRAEFALMGALAAVIGLVVLAMRKRRAAAEADVPEAEQDPAPGAAAIPAR
jgi:predicted MFS family arabinose efflux permease